MFKILLCIPPDYDYNFPPLGTPALCGFLKHKGLDVQQLDLNLKYRDFLIKHISGINDIRTKKFILKSVLKKFFKEKLHNRYYADLLVRDNDGFLPYLPYDNNTNSSFYFTERLLSSEHLWPYLEDSRENTFYQFYRQEKILDFLDKQKINLLGISIISPSQVIPSLTLGLLVKQNLPHIQVTIGGQWPTLYRKVILEKKDLFCCFDSMIVFEGETALYNLILKLQRQSNGVRKIPQVFFKEDSLDLTQRYLEEDLNQLPCPDFDGLPLQDYNGIEDIGVLPVTYETSRGCYWAKCAYCVDLPLPKPSYRRKHPELVARDIQELKKKYMAAYLMLGDPGMSPRQMSEVSKEMLKQGVHIRWWCMARLDPGFNYELFNKAKQAGLTQVNFGFESASDRICELLHKGNKKEISRRVMKDCAQAGIKVDLQTMLGLPGETFSDGLETVDFLVKNKQYIDNVTFNIYYLTPANYVYENPQNYGIEYEKNSALIFKFFIPFKNEQGISRNEACLLQQLYGKLSEGTQNKAADKSAINKLSFAKDVSLRRLRFVLNEESTQMPYLYRGRSKDYIFLNDIQEKIADILKKNMDDGKAVFTLGKTYPEADTAIREFIEYAVDKGFLEKGA